MSHTKGKCNFAISIVSMICTTWTQSWGQEGKLNYSFHIGNAHVKSSHKNLKACFPLQA